MTANGGHCHPAGLRAPNGGFQQHLAVTSTALYVLSWSTSVEADSAGSVRLFAVWTWKPPFRSVRQSVRSRAGERTAAIRMPRWTHERPPCRRNQLTSASDSSDFQTALHASPISPPAI